MEYKCNGCSGRLPAGSLECPSCGQRFEQAVPGDAETPAAARIPSKDLEFRLDHQGPGAKARDRRGKWRFGTKRLIAATAVVLVVGGGTIIYNCWDSWFPPRPSSGYDEPTAAQVQAVTSQDIPVTPAASTPCNPLAPPDPQFGGCAPGAAPKTVPTPQSAPTQAMTDAQRAQADVEAAQGRWTAQQQGQQQWTQNQAQQQARQVYPPSADGSDAQGPQAIIQDSPPAPASASPGTGASQENTALQIARDKFNEDSQTLDRDRENLASDTRQMSSDQDYDNGRGMGELTSERDRFEVKSSQTTVDRDQAKVDDDQRKINEATRE